MVENHKEREGNPKTKVEVVENHNNKRTGIPKTKVEVVENHKEIERERERKRERRQVSICKPQEQKGSYTNVEMETNNKDRKKETIDRNGKKKIKIPSSSRT